MDDQPPTVSAEERKSSSAVVPQQQQPTFYDPQPVLCAPVTPQQVSAFNPRERTQPGLLMMDGSEYYGDVILQKPHGIGIMLFRSSSGLYANGDRYGGHWKNGLFDGEGVLLASAFTYQGGWLEGKMHGHGKMVYNHSVSDIVLRGISAFSPFEKTHTPLEYIGDFHVTHHRHGRGMMRYANGDVYEGMWASNRRHGQGRLVTDDDEVYEGEWNRDERHGFGKINYADGGEFKGMMVHDKRHGEGVMMFPNGDEYYGSFTNDKIHGQGTMRYKNGDVYEGMWKDGLRNGEGKYTLRKKGATVEGCFLNGLIQGRGVVRHPGISTFVGEFDRGERKHGTIFWDNISHGDRSCYQGEWLGEAMHGCGLLWYRDGGFFFGRFVKNKRHGAGNMRYNDGSEFSGCFNNDLREGLGILQTASGSIQAGFWYGDLFVEGYDGEWDGVSFNGIGRLLLRETSLFSPVKGKGGNSGGGGVSVTNSNSVEAITAITERSGDKAGLDAMAQTPMEYFGLFRDGKRHGPGILRLVGHVVMGSWVNDVLSCESGSWEFPSSDLYIGGFQNGFREGPNGCMWFTDGSYFSGHWRLDAPVGSGVFHATDPMNPIYASVVKTTDGAATDVYEGCGNSDCKGSSSSLGVMDMFLGLFRRKTPQGNREKRFITGFHEHYVLQGEWDISPMPYTLYRSLMARGNTLSTSNGAGVTGASSANNTGSSGIGGSGSLQKPPASISLGMFEGCGTVIFKSGVCLRTQWLHNYPRLMLPHRPDAVFHNKIFGSGGEKQKERDFSVAATSSVVGGAQKSCTLCEKPFTFFRKETVCILCERTSCNSCLHPIDVRGHPRVEALVRLRIDRLGGGGGDITPAPAHVPVCGDCARAVLLGLGFSTLWVPMGCSGVATPLKDDVPAPEEKETAQTPPKTPGGETVEVGSSFSQATFSDDLYLVYEGYTCNCVPHIYGSMWWGKRAYYLGSFDEGRCHGRGLQIMANGEKYVGDFSDNEWHGMGIYCAEDGSSYEGVWEHSKLKTLLYHGEVDEQYQRHGRGCSYEADGTRYNGEWRQGERHGTGVLQMSDGSVYSGEFAFGCMEGEGKLLHGTSVFYGLFRGGKKNGAGTERFGECVVEGKWLDDMLSGFVRMYDGLSETVYESTYQNGNECDECFLPPLMVDDMHSQKCAQCHTSFSLFLRRHHCRLCGDIVCDSCSQRRAAMPLHFKMDTHQRVCDRCFQRLEQRRMLGIRRYKNGEVYAGCWTSGQWVSRGLLRRADGSVIVMDAAGRPIVEQENSGVIDPSVETKTVDKRDKAAVVAAETTTKKTAQHKLPMDAAPDVEVLRQLPASPSTEVDAFSLWWGAMLSVAGLSLPLELTPLTCFEFPSPPQPKKALKLFSQVDDVDDDASAVRVARFIPSISPQVPPPPRLPETGVPLRPLITAEPVLQRIKDTRMEMFSPPSSPPSSGNEPVLSCYRRTPLLPPTPQRPPPVTNEHVAWDDWNTRGVPRYQDTAESTQWGLPERQHLPFACPFIRASVDDADRAVRGDSRRWLPVPPAGPKIFSITDTHTSGVVVHQREAKTPRNGE